MTKYNKHVHDILEAGRWLLSDVKPSTWTEQHRSMTTETSPFPGPFKYDRTPYLREIVDCLSPGHPARIVAVMKGAQIGFSTGVIESGIGYIISENPGNILFLSGHQDLSEEAMNVKIDQMIDSCGLRPLIRPNVIRKKNARTGDTAKSKEFPGGYLVAGSANNHKLLRQRSVRYGFVDDFDAVKASSKESGDTRKLIERRFAAYADKMKLYFISTPELKQTSNIEPVYMKGDQRKYHVPCPCCGVAIALEWKVDLKGSDGREKGGITWKLDEHGKVVPGSVGYICQECGGFFDDSDKQELLTHGEWIPTAEPEEIGIYSYHISSLYAPVGMYDWAHYVNEYLEAFPTEGGGKESLQKVFTCTVLGYPFQQESEALKANDLQQNNIRAYPIGIVPEKISLNDGNGRILLLTCACDLNGLEKDARLDWEIVGWAESGSSYSIAHGSIGTFIPREGSKKVKADRERWTYEYNRPRSVWPELTKVFSAEYMTDTDRKLRVIMAGVDCGRHTQHAYTYLDKLNSKLRVGLKGVPETKLMKFGTDVPTFRPARERSNLFLLEVNEIKDDLAGIMRLQWDEFDDEKQPPGFMNFPTPSGGAYLFGNFFSHFEAEHRVLETKDGRPIGARWEKKNSAVQNHHWDVRVYNMALRDILVALLCKELKIKNPSWADFVNTFAGKK
jgi:phage terminase large subunit GpA-like protein